MQQIPIQTAARQQWQIVLDGVLFDLTFVAGPDQCMYATVKANGTTLVQGTRCVSGYQIVPYRYMEPYGAGNFAFATVGDANPWWEEFNTTQFLQYATAAELADMRGGYVQV